MRFTHSGGPSRPAAPGAIDWTARRTWQASLLLVAVGLAPLVVAGTRLLPCALGALTSLIDSGAVGRASPVGGLACPWSWQLLLCAPLTQFTTWLHPSLVAGRSSAQVGSGTELALSVLLAIPSVGLLVGSALALARAAGTWVTSVAQSHARAAWVERVALDGTHPTMRRVGRAARAASLPVELLHRIQILDVPTETASVVWTYGLWHPRIALSRGLLDRLDDAALSAVLAHEATHVIRRDPLHRLLSRALRQACPQAPVLRALEEHLQFRQEIEADQHAAVVAGGPAPVARALVALLASAGTRHASAARPTSQFKEQAKPGARDERGREAWRPRAVSTRYATSATRAVGGAEQSRASKRLSRWWPRWVGAWASGKAPRTAQVQQVQTGQTPRSLGRRVDVLLGDVQVGGFIAPSAVVVLSVLGIAAYWCLLAW